MRQNAKRPREELEMLVWSPEQSHAYMEGRSDPKNGEDEEVEDPRLHLRWLTTTQE